MKKSIICLLSIILLTGCSKGTKAPVTTTTPIASDIPVSEPTLKVLSPAGAPALSELGAIEKGYDVEITDGPDKLQAELINANSDYDVIVAPTNLGVKLASLGKSEYKLLEVVTWGNLYLVGPEGTDLENTTIAGFGEQAVTGLVFKSVYPELYDKVNWGYGSVTEAQAALLSGEAEVAILAEPAATATIAKAKEKNKELTILSNLQELWGEGNGYPQAGIFVKSSVYEENKDAVNAYITSIEDFISQVNNDESKEVLTNAIDSIGAENLSVPNSKIIAKVWDRLNIHPTKASECEDDIANFLKLFDVKDITNCVFK